MCPGDLGEPSADLAGAGHNGDVTNSVIETPDSPTLQIIAQRHACRAYAPTPVPYATLRAIAEAGVRAPSALNRQPWRLVLIQDKAVIDEIDALGLARLREQDEAGYNRIQGRGGKLLYDAPAMIVVAVQPQPGRLSADLDAGIVASHLTLAATSLGIGSVICGLAHLAFDGPDGARLQAHLGFPEGFEFGISVLLGNPVAPGEPHAPDYAKIIEA